MCLFLFCPNLWQEKSHHSIKEASYILEPKREADISGRRVAIERRGKAVQSTADNWLKYKNTKENLFIQL